MEKAETIIRPTASPYVEHLLKTFQNDTPRNYEALVGIDLENVLKFQKNKNTFFLITILLSMLFFILQSYPSWRPTDWYYALLCAGALSTSYFMVLGYGDFARPRKAIVSSWIFQTANNALPQIAPSVEAGYEEDLRLFKADASRLTTVLHKQAEKIVETHPLSQFPDMMSHFIRSDKDVETYITACYTHAETLNPDTQVHF